MHTLEAVHLLQEPGPCRVEPIAPQLRPELLPSRALLRSHNGNSRIKAQSHALMMSHRVLSGIILSKSFP